MTPTLEDVLAAFRQQVENLANEADQIGNRVFRKALYLSMLDGLSACGYPNEIRPGHRFRTFILDIAGWRDGERVSLPQASLYFRGNVAMKASIDGLLAAWPWGQPQNITLDPLPTQLPANDQLWKVTHVNLLWQLRNSILHAFADPGGFDPGTRNQPFYTGDISTHTWRLAMPERFLRNLLNDGLNGLIAFCRRNGQDPQAHLGAETWLRG